MRNWFTRHRLLAFSRSRAHPEQAASPTLKFKLWSGVGEETEDEKRLKMLAASGRRLEGLMSQPGWRDLIECRDHYANLHAAQTLQLETADRDRFRAACLRAGNYEVFTELNLRVKRGKQADEQLKVSTRKEEAAYV